jgi:hypothetical protein
MNITLSTVLVILFAVMSAAMFSIGAAGLGILNLVLVLIIIVIMALGDILTKEKE